MDAAGFDVVVNLAPARWERNFEEGFRVTQAGMTYIQIPVDWQDPSLRDLELFFDVMEANEDRNVYVHCFANMRVSVFVYLYRTLRKGMSGGRSPGRTSSRSGTRRTTRPRPSGRRFIAAAKAEFGG